MSYDEVHAHIDIWQQEPTEMEEKENNNKTQNKKQINKKTNKQIKKQNCEKSENQIENMCIDKIIANRVKHVIMYVHRVWRYKI